MLLDVLTELSADTGLSISDKRNTLLAIALRAAKEMHKMLECNKIYREVTLVVPRDKVVSLPGFIGELKGMRMTTNEITFDVNSIGQPRYATNTLGYKYKNWRDLGESPVHTLPAAVGQLTLTTDEVEEEPVSVIVSGQSDKANRVEEVVEISGNSQVTTTLFGPRIDSIVCATKDRMFDITVLDTDGNELGILYNDQNKTRYKIVDVSRVYWSIDTSADESLIDVLYKLPITTLCRDSDSFYAGDDYDEAWYNMSMFFYLKPIQNRMPDALTHRAAALDMLRTAKDGGESGIVKKLQWGRNPFHSIFNRTRYFPGSVTNVDNQP